MPVRPAPSLFRLLTLAACAAAVPPPSVRRAPRRPPSPPPARAAPAALVAPEGIRLPRTLPPHRAAGWLTVVPSAAGFQGTGELDVELASSTDVLLAECHVSWW